MQTTWWWSDAVRCYPIEEQVSMQYYLSNATHLCQVHRHLPLLLSLPPRYRLQLTEGGQYLIFHRQTCRPWCDSCPTPRCSRYPWTMFWSLCWLDESFLFAPALLRLTPLQVHQWSTCGPSCRRTGPWVRDIHELGWIEGACQPQPPQQTSSPLTLRWRWSQTSTSFDPTCHYCLPSSHPLSWLI